MHAPDVYGSGSMTKQFSLFFPLSRLWNSTAFCLVSAFQFLLFLHLLFFHNEGSWCHLPQEMSRRHFFFPSLLSLFLLRGMEVGNSFMSQPVHLCSSWFVSIFSVSPGSKTHLFSSGERHSISVHNFWNTMVRHLPQSEVASLGCKKSLDLYPITEYLHYHKTFTTSSVLFRFLRGLSQKLLFLSPLALPWSHSSFDPNRIPELCFMTKTKQHKTKQKMSSLCNWRII